MKEYLFKDEISIIGIQRSGIHGLCNWVTGLYPSVIYKNEVYNDLCSNNYMFKNFVNGELVSSHGMELPKTAKTIIVSSENLTPSYVLNRIEDPTYLGSKKKIIEINQAKSFSLNKKYLFILRDPFNWLASVFKMWSDNDKKIRQRISEWLEIASEYAGETSYLRDRSDVFLVKYGDWFTSPTYRESIARFLGSDFSDNNFGKYFPEILGSSFNTSNVKGNSDFLNRWVNYKSNPTYLKYFQDYPELSRYSKEIFNIDPLS
jgi:hypothetical protein